MASHSEDAQETKEYSDEFVHEARAAPAEFIFGPCVEPHKTKIPLGFVDHAEASCGKREADKKTLDCHGNSIAGWREKFKIL